MRTFFEYLRGVGDYKRVEARHQQIYESDLSRIPGSFLDFSLNRDIQNWPAPEGWELVSLSENSGTPGRQSSASSGFQVIESWAFDWVKPSQSFSFISPSCGAPATGEFAVTYGSTIEISLEIADLKGFTFAISYSEIEQATSNLTMDSSNAERPNSNYTYMVIPLVEVIYFRKIEDYYPGQSGSVIVFFSNGPFKFSKGYERELYPMNLGYAVARKPCLDVIDEEGSELEEE